MPPLGTGMKDYCLDTLFSLGKACKEALRNVLVP